MVRESTVRPNIAYSVVAYDGTDEDTAVQQVIESALARYPIQDRIIVYCRTIAQMKYFAEVIGGTAFHRKVGDIVQKRDIIAMLTSGEER